MSDRDGDERVQRELEREVFALRAQVVALTEELEAARSWDGMMTVLDEHYPPDVFDGSSGDEGPRIVVLLRRVAALEAGLRAAVWQFNEAVSMLREARIHLVHSDFIAGEIDEGIGAMQAALVAAAALLEGTEPEVRDE